MYHIGFGDLPIFSHKAVGLGLSSKAPLPRWLCPVLRCKCTPHRGRDGIMPRAIIIESLRDIDPQQGNKYQ